MYSYDTCLNNEINFEHKFNLFCFVLFFLQLPLCDSYQIMYTTNDIMITACGTHVHMHVVHMCHIPSALHAIELSCLSTHCVRVHTIQLHVL